MADLRQSEDFTHLSDLDLNDELADAAPGQSPRIDAIERGKGYSFPHSCQHFGQG